MHVHWQMNWFRSIPVVGSIHTFDGGIGRIFRAYSECLWEKNEGTWQKQVSCTT